MPSTSHGIWSARLLGLSGALFAGFFALVGLGERGGETFFSNPLLAVTILGAAISAMCSGCLGVAAARRHDRSLVVLAAIVFGAFVAIFAAAEVLFPH